MYKLSEKLAIIINGKPKTGKDTICRCMSLLAHTKTISIVTPLQKVADVICPRRDKTDEYRRLLSGIDVISTQFNDYPMNYILDEYHNFLNNEYYDILLCHIRRPCNIATAVRTFDCKTVTLLVKSPLFDKKEYNNVSDDGVFNQGYDFEFNNDIHISELHNSVDFLLHSICNAKGITLTDVSKGA